MTIAVNYEKRKNQQFFQALEGLGFTKAQNYIPLYKIFFVLNDDNYTSVNLNHIHYIDTIKKSVSDNIHLCTVKSNIGKPRQEKVFFKLAPLLDPVKYMIGKYTLNDKLMSLPSLNSTSDTINSKIIDPNNCSYVDGFFSYLSNQLLSSKMFVHGVRYYGSFLTIKKNLKLNVYDDLEYLIKSDFFNSNKNRLFTIDNYSYLFDDDTSRSELPLIKINQDETSNSSININFDSIEDTKYGDIFVEDIKDIEDIEDVEDVENVEDIKSDKNNIEHHNQIELTVENIEDHNVMTNSPESEHSIITTNSKNNSLKLSPSDTDSSDEENSEVSYTDDDNDEEISEDSSDGSDCGSSDTSESEEEIINAYFPEFPIQVICMEACSDTLDQLILDEKMNENLWLSALMQIIMTLITYQKVFSFTHNDLHTNNVMYVSTKRKFLYYCYKETYYRVPTYGKIFKIIDFGRAIYKHDGKLMCSDSFSPTGDAASQYNIEPYYNQKKPRLEPNYSFDLCRLACSIFDYLVEDIKDVKELTKCDTITRIIVEWCIDDNGINVLYKNNGADRYPDFKLYKMIARCVHNHTPHAQLDRPEFKKYVISKNDIPNSETVMNIDEM